MTGTKSINKWIHLVITCLIVLIPLVDYAQTIEQLKKKVATEKKPIELIKLHTDIGTEYYRKGDFVSSHEHFLESLKIAEKIGDEHNCAVSYNNLSIVYLNTEKYDKAEFYAKKNLNLSKKLNDKEHLANAYNTLGNIHYMKMEDSLSLHFYKKAIHYRKMMNDSLGLFIQYKNLGALHFEMGDTLKGIDYIKGSLSYLKSIDDSLEWFSAYLTVGEAYVYQGNLEKGKDYLDSCTMLLPRINAHQMIDDYYYVLHRYYQEQNNHEQALVSYKLYEKYKDSVENVEKHQQISELGVKYETEKKEQRINLQNKLLKEEEHSKNLILIISGILLFLLLTAFFMYRYVQKNRMVRIEKEHTEAILTEIINTEEKERNRIAKDLHDGIVQDITSLKFMLNAIQAEAPTKLHPSLSQLNEEIDKISNEVRELSYQMMPITLKELGLLKALEEMMNRNLNHNKIDFEFNALGFSDQRLPEKIEVTVYRICQELINNTLKHSSATSVSLLVQLHTNMLQLTFEDDGVGFDVENVKKGVGLNSLTSRVAWIKGSLEFDSSEITKGTTAFIRIPL